MCLKEAIIDFVSIDLDHTFNPSFQKDHSFYDLSKSKAPQELYLTRVADLMKEHSNFLGFDLGNELNCCWRADQLESGDA